MNGRTGGGRPLANLRCPLCGGANQCAPAGAGTFEVACWCKTASISRETLSRIPPGEVDRSCLCPRCARGLDADGAPP